MNTFCVTLKTTDGGLNWFEQNNGSPNIYAVYFLNQTTGFTVGYNIQFDGSTIKKTTDGGASWVERYPNPIGYYRNFWFINDNVGFCVGEHLIRTTDGGNIWSLVSNDIPYTKEIKFVNENVGWMVSSRSAFRTSDGGNNWVEFSLPELKQRFNNYTNYNSISVNDANVVSVAGDHGTIIKSTNTGASWVILSGILNDIFDVQFLDSLNGFITASNGYIYNTNDGGASWTPEVTPTTRDVLNLQFINQTTGFATTDDEILKTYNGGQTWWKLSFVPNHQYFTFSDIYFVDDLNGWACGDYSTIIHSSNGGETWQVQLEDNGVAEIKSIYFRDVLNGLAIGVSIVPPGYWEYYLYKTTDGGNNWISNDLGIQDGYEGKILFLNEQDGWLLLNDRLMVTSDGGENWSLKFTANDLWAALDMSIDQNKLWITTWYGFILNSTNNGESWGIQGNYGDFHNLRSIELYNDQIGWIVGSPNVIYKTYDGGQGIIEPPTIPALNFPPDGAYLQEPFSYSWMAREDCLSRLQISTDIDFHSLDFDGLYLNNSALAWYTCKYINQIKYYWRVRSENQLGVGEWSEVRYFKTNIQSWLGIEEEINTLQYNLSQNYPNPFNPVTKIKYQIPELNKIKITVYDILGREVGILVNEEKPAGIYELTWNASKYPSGVYFYQLRAGSYIETKKMILLK